MTVTEAEIAVQVAREIQRPLRILVENISLQPPSMQVENAREHFVISLAEAIAASIAKAVREGIK